MILAQHGDQDLPDTWSFVVEGAIAQAIGKYDRSHRRTARLSARNAEHSHSRLLFPSCLVSSSRSPLR